MLSVCPIATLCTLLFCRVHHDRENRNIPVPPTNTGESSAPRRLGVAMRKSVFLLKYVTCRFVQNRTCPNDNDRSGSGSGSGHENTVPIRLANATSSTELHELNGAPRAPCVLCVRGARVGRFPPFRAGIVIPSCFPNFECGKVVLPVRVGVVSHKCFALGKRSRKLGNAWTWKRMVERNVPNGVGGAGSGCRCHAVDHTGTPCPCYRSDRIGRTGSRRIVAGSDRPHRATQSHTGQGSDRGSDRGSVDRAGVLSTRSEPTLPAC